MCDFLLSIAIAGVVQSEAGWVSIEYLNQSQVEEIFIPADEYLKCFPQNIND